MSEGGSGSRSIDPCSEESLGVEGERGPKRRLSRLVSASAESVDHQIFARSLALDSLFARVHSPIAVKKRTVVASPLLQVTLVAHRHQNLMDTYAGFVDSHVVPLAFQLRRLL